MSLSTDIKAVLEGNSQLLTILTGGIYDYDETGRTGISKTNTPAAFTGPILNPCAMVKVRSTVPQGDIADSPAQKLSVVRVVEIYLYQENGYVNIENAQNAIFTLLHEKRFSWGYMRWANTLEGRSAEELNGARLIRADYQIDTIKG